MPDDGRHRLGLLARVHHQVPAGVGRGQGQETGPHARVELGRLRLQPVRSLGEPLAGDLRRDVQQHRQMRREAVGRPAVDPGDLRRGQITAGALVGDRGVDVAVRDHDRAALQRGPDHRVHVLGAVRRVQQRLRAVRQSGARHVQQDRPQPLADRRRPGLARDDDLVALVPDPLGERLGLGGLPGAVAALQGDEEAGRRGHLLRVVPAEQRVLQVLPQRHTGTVVGLGQHQRGQGQQQRADQHQRERGTAVREDELAALQPVRPDERGDERREHRAERDTDPGDRVQMLRGPGPPELLGLLVEQGVPGVGGHARADPGQRDDQQHGGDVRDESRGQQRDAGEGDRQRQQPAPRQGGQHGGRRTDADDHAAGQREHQQAVEHRPAAQVLGVQHGHRDPGGHRPGDGRARRHQQRDRAGTALVDARAGLGPAQPLKRRPRARGACVGQFQEGQHGEGRGEQAGRDVRREGRLVLAEPVEAGTEQVVQQRRDDECGGGQGDRDEARTQRQTAQGVHVVRQRSYRRALRGRRRQQGGGRALPAHSPETLGDAGHEDGDQEDGQCVVRRPVDPQRRDDQQGGPQAVRADHGPAPVERALLGGERRQGAEEYGTEEERRQDAHSEDGRHCERHAPVAAAEGPLGDRRLKGQQYQYQEREDVTDTSHQLRAPQAPELRSAQQSADGALAGVHREGVVRCGVGGRWLLGSRHAFSLSGRTDSPARPSVRTPAPTPN
ncbi:putative Thymidylate kinase [Streptomyces viridochromogenes Tue57]|uniref:Putative Thymidylate kinase n=1 Tax=Streptomyces viridochromogenes Tue57 TaxID=1160705 RepID=L8PFZ3_STRVR|nr:putative Thymidylate kinase [Streptomyces viridochromogenes Tue57]